MKDRVQQMTSRDASSSCIFMSSTKRITHIGGRYIILTADCHTEEAVKHLTSVREDILTQHEKQALVQLNLLQNHPRMI
ncbi:hypothetical protein TNCT_339801 [Trichonephila clavata]|uniref:Uncharacterized protein n=1 Tax=Trichonephila clavata TaxID=2740835 RepID=A0A8X6GJY2_TRICU|nr:hypothetical protein TNCT_339801 [Trichonephila clavata]